MPITYTLPDTITKKDRAEINNAIDIALRNAKIAEQYPEMRDEYGFAEAQEKLAKKFNVSKHTVYNVVYRYNV